MNAGFFQTNFFPLDFFGEDFWQDYAPVVANFEIIRLNLNNVTTGLDLDDDSKSIILNTKTVSL